ncbi:MAG: NupC/NupG family nucleoside CNT transporter [Planctomycetaceae bacterium]|nr:NupC/NupG family nucleoside CNT transporter [Planctomycetaceae bacterium]
MNVLRAALALMVICLVAWALSSHRRQFPWRIVLLGTLSQVVLAGFFLGTSGGQDLFRAVAQFVGNVLGKAEVGATLVFGPLADPAQMAPVFGEQGAFVFAFAGRGLVAILFFSALMAVLYHIGIMQVVVWLVARVMMLTLRVSGAEAMAVAANIFVGQTEAPLVVRPYIPLMTQSELNAMMTGGFATIAGTVLALYMGFLGPEYGPHLITASVLGAPAAFVIAKIMLPERETSTTIGAIPFRVERTAGNLVEAAALGTQDGLKLWLNVIAMLITFTALVALADWPIGALGEALGVEGGLSLARLFGFVLAPFALLLGVDGWHDAQVFGALLGIKLTLTELVAFARMQDMLPGGTGAMVFEHSRSATMATYALCGFANFASIGIQIGGITPLAPERGKDIARLVTRAMLGGALASCSSAAIAGALL